MHRYIGKETSRRWEQGDDISMVDFRCAEYHNGKVVADKETRKRIVRAGIRTVERGTGKAIGNQLLLWLLASGSCSSRRLLECGFPAISVRPTSIPKGLD